MSSPNQPPLIHPYVERILRQIILKDLANKGRPSWDKPHTEAVVFWIKELLRNLDQPNLNSQVLITAAYAHDWGYAGLFQQKSPITIDQARTKKAVHQARGARWIERLIYQRLSRHFTESEILRVTHLVLVHDSINELTAEDELLLMEGDALGMIDVERVTPTLSAKENQYLLKTSLYNKRLPKFIHSEAKKAAEKLLQKREAYYQALA